MKIKNKVKLNKLILYIDSNSFFLFLFVTQSLRKLKICKILKNIDYILFSFIFSMMKPNMKKSFSRFHSELKENNFLIYGCLMKNSIENQI